MKRLIKKAQREFYPNINKGYEVLMAFVDGGKNVIIHTIHNNLSYLLGKHDNGYNVIDNVLDGKDYNGTLIHLSNEQELIAFLERMGYTYR